MHPQPTSFQPTEADLTSLGFRTGQPYQPHPTRHYYAALPSGNVLSLVPRPGLHMALEYTGGGTLVARHYLSSVQDLLESVRGGGRREVVRP